jgi:isocitrate dehydrogenase kinase/phosphatase
MSDFETAFIIAFSKAFPESIHYGCHFHYTQCLNRHLQDLKLSTEYENRDSDVHKWLRLFTALPFVPRDKDQIAFDLLVNHKPIFVDPGLVKIMFFH